MTVSRKVGIYLSVPTILKNPGYLEALRKALGLNLIIIGFTGRVPEEVARESPFDGLPPSGDCLRSLLAQNIDGELITLDRDLCHDSIGPNVALGGDEEELRRAIALAQGLGIEVWMLSAAWTLNDYQRFMFCPSNAAVNHWYEVLYAYLAADYGVDGLDITHARYPMVSELPGLLVCACPECARAAAGMGYDMAQMTAALRGARGILHGLDPKRAAGLGRLSWGLLDYCQLLGLDAGVIQWFRFRCDLVARNVAELRRAVRGAAKAGFVFGSDTYPATLAMLVGHDYTRWGEHSDFASPLLSHAEIFVTKPIVLLAQHLRGLIRGLGEADALHAVYRLLGYDALALPSRYADYALGEPDCEFRHVPLRELLGLDMAKARLFLPPELPSYPIFQGGGEPYPWPREIIEGVIRDAGALGHNGVIFQGTRSLIDFPLQG